MVGALISWAKRYGPLALISLLAVVVVAYHVFDESYLRAAFVLGAFISVVLYALIFGRREDASCHEDVDIDQGWAEDDVERIQLTGAIRSQIGTLRSRLDNYIAEGIALGGREREFFTGLSPKQLGYIIHEHMDPDAFFDTLEGSARWYYRDARALQQANILFKDNGVGSSTSKEELDAIVDQRKAYREWVAETKDRYECGFYGRGVFTRLIEWVFSYLTKEGRTGSLKSDTLSDRFLLHTDELLSLKQAYLDLTTKLLHQHANDPDLLESTDFSKGFLQPFFYMGFCTQSPSFSGALEEMEQTFDMNYQFVNFEKME